jgi:hypothetical protein
VQLEASIVAADKACEEVRVCFSNSESLRADLGRKTAQLNSEFKGAIPPEFATFLNNKAQRHRRMHEACMQKYKEGSKTIDEVWKRYASAGATVSDLSKQRSRIESLSKRFRALQPSSGQQAPKVGQGSQSPQ